VQGRGAVGLVPLSGELLLVGAGVMSALPLVAFGAAANRVPLSTLGVLQYFAPTLQFLCGVFFFHEHMSPLRWVGFSLIWVSLLGFALEGLLNAPRAGAAPRS
jgi:chloramphenicol-sensitive protein RarD